MHDLLYALRGFRRAPLAAITIVCTVALGLGLVTVGFTLLNSVLFRVDAVRDPDSLAGIERPPQPGADEHIAFTLSEYQALRRETSVFTDVIALLRGTRTRIVLSRLLGLVGLGLACGTTLAAAMTMVLRSTPLASITAGVVHVFDPIAYLGSTVCIVIASLLAAWLPARRAATIDPIAALRQD